MQTFTPDDLKYTYSPAHEPIGMVEPGETFTVITEDCFTGRYATPDGFTAESAAWVEENLNGVTGPIGVRGAEPGQVVAIAVEELEAITPGAVVVSRCEAHSPADWWHEEDHVVNLDMVDGHISLADDWLVPARPLIGCLATQPSRETVLSRHEGDYGGNVDCGEITAGATVILPVTVPDAGLYFGDCKAAMGDGEVVAAPEIGARIVASARPVARPRTMGTPRVITSQRLTTIASDISLADACRIAFKELKLWLEDEWQLSSEQTAVVMGIGAHCRIGQMSNQLHTGKCSIDRSLLPDIDERRGAHG